MDSTTKENFQKYSSDLEHIILQATSDILEKSETYKKALNTVREMRVSTSGIYEKSLIDFICNEIEEQSLKNEIKQ